jgi:FeS assembly SUF system regulator
VIRLSKLTDYGLVIMTHVARKRSGTLHTARGLAAESGLPVPTVSKLLKVLLQHGFLVSTRGTKGGYSLAREAQEVSVAEMIAALEGPIALTDCSTEITGLCEIERGCPAKHNQRIINQVVRGALERLTLADLVHPLRVTAIQTTNGNFVPSFSLTSGRAQ